MNQLRLPVTATDKLQHRATEQGKPLCVVRFTVQGPSLKVLGAVHQVGRSPRDRLADLNADADRFPAQLDVERGPEGMRLDLRRIDRAVFGDGEADVVAGLDERPGKGACDVCETARLGERYRLRRAEENAKGHTHLPPPRF